MKSKYRTEGTAILFDEKVTVEPVTNHWAIISSFISIQKKMFYSCRDCFSNKPIYFLKGNSMRNQIIQQNVCDCKLNGKLELWYFCVCFFAILTITQRIFEAIYSYYFHSKILSRMCSLWKLYYFHSSIFPIVVK